MEFEMHYFGVNITFGFHNILRIGAHWLILCRIYRIELLCVRC